jgi:hypothetical protein
MKRTGSNVLVMAGVVGASLALGAAAALGSFQAEAGPGTGRASASWRVIGSGDDIGSGAVAGAAKHRVSRMAIRVRVTGQPVAHVWTVMLCSDGPFVRSNRGEFNLSAGVAKLLRPPIASPENCGVTAYARSTVGSVRIEILASP